MEPSDPARRRPIWLLYLLAGLSFVPGLGFFFGSIAVSWGLVSSHPGARRGLIIGAVGAVLNLAVIIVSLSTMGRGNPAFQRGVVEQTQRQLGDVVAALESYRAATNSYPPTLLALQRARGPLRPVNILDFGGGALRMPRMYQYVPAANGLSYDLFAVGPDGKSNTSDDVRPVLADSLLGRTGLRPPR